MWTTLLRNFASACCLLGLWAIAGCGKSNPTANETNKPIVVSTIFAYYDAARAIGADRIDNRIILPPDASPHDYNPSPSDKVNAAKANLYIKNGMGLDDRFDKLVEGSGAKTLVISEVIPQDLLMKTAEISLDPAKSAEAQAAEANPHIWLDPMVQIEAARQIRDALSALDPADKSMFEVNTKTYIQEINDLNGDFKAAVATFKTREFIGFHSAYEYLARRYGLQQIASIEEIPDAGLSMAQTEKEIKLINDKHIKYIAVETALSGKAADVIKDRTGVKTITLQPLETYDNLKDTYISLMRQNLEALKTALD
jgi:ABC-type Zn uptake system ZnuABC Zn-binding protein ZnuA